MQGATNCAGSKPIRPLDKITASRDKIATSKNKKTTEKSVVIAYLQWSQAKKLEESRAIFNCLLVASIRGSGRNNCRVVVICSNDCGGCQTADGGQSTKFAASKNTTATVTNPVTTLQQNCQLGLRSSAKEPSLFFVQAGISHNS